MAVGDLKELTDNGIDACEEAEIAPIISVTVTKGGINHCRGQRPRHSSQDDSIGSRLLGPGLFSRSLRLTDTR